MKLHRLVLTNYRGVTHREIAFPDRGVAVVSGANEVGKSSMIEALDLLLEAKDRSTKKEVKQVKPTHADVGAEVTAEISTGPYRFVYRKRFHKKCETQLSVLAPVREQLTGDEAHERVCAMLAETVDIELWRAQRVLQANSTEAVNLSGCDALSRALDVAAGQSAALSGAEPLLVERIDAEYARYFTPTGRPTGEWSAATARLAAADQEVGRCAAAVAEVDDGVRTHAKLTDRLAEVQESVSDARRRLAAAREASDAVATVAAQSKQAELIAAAAQARLASAVAARDERRRLRADVDARSAAVAQADAAVREAAEEEATAREVDVAAAALVEQSGADVAALQSRVDTARLAVDRLSDRDEADRLASRLAKIDSTRGGLAHVQTSLGAVVLTESSMSAIEKAAAAVERAAGQVELASARIELTAAADIELRINGERVRLAAGKAFTTRATAPTAIQVPGMLAANIIPGTPACDNQEKLAVAQEVLSAALAAAQVHDVEHARALAQQRRELITARDRLAATLAGLCGEEPVEALQSRLALLRDRGRDLQVDKHLEMQTARTELDAAVGAHRRAATDCEAHRKVAAAASAKLAEKSMRATVLREKLIAARAELDAASDRLARQREQRPDDEIAVRAEADAETAGKAAQHAARLGAELAGAAPDRVATELADAARDAEELSRRHRQIDDELRDVTTRLRVYGTEGRQGRLDVAAAEREQAESEYTRIRRRARAAQTLRSVMARHRDDTRLRYVEPFRAQVERLGRLVFGESFELQVDTDLRIVSRTLSGRTVPYESLSGGAKEQLGIVARLAGAALVAKDDAVPVIIDDALGFSDADRLAKMGTVFDAVGGDGQVIVLTCSPARYDSIDGAHRIELTA
ncbi:MAG: AAA family ATPase [Mycobacteriaceae bacterium]|nr:AAA family ATPase [Mycobacteriaceae bacterium]